MFCGSATKLLFVPLHLSSSVGSQHGYSTPKMKKGLLDSRAGIAGVALLVTGLLTVILGSQVVHPTPDAAAPWYAWFLAPGLLGGMILSAPAGGVNRIPEWLGACAFFVANVLFWAPVAYVVIRVVCRSCITRERSRV